MQWYDEKHRTPYLVCMAELSNGKKVEAIWAMGDWETLKGEVIHPVAFAPLHVEIMHENGTKQILGINTPLLVSLTALDN